MEPEQNINIETPELNQVNNSDKSGNIMEQGLSAVKKPGKGLIAGMIVCAILAVAGIGFGVWAMTDGNAKTDELNSQVAKSNAQVAQLEKQNEELIEEAKNAKGSGSSSDVDEDVNSADYIYIEEWGIKIKKTDGLRITGYEYATSGDTSEESVSLLGIRSGNYDVLPKFAQINENVTMGNLIRLRNGGSFPYGQLVYTDAENNNYYYQHPQAVYSVDSNEQTLELEATDLIQQMLSNSDNYSNI